LGIGYYAVYCFLGACPQTPWVGFAEGWEAELTLLLLFWKRRKWLNIGLLGARPQTPWVGFAEGWGVYNLLRSGTNVFLLLFWKRRKWLNIVLLGECPQILMVDFADCQVYVDWFDVG
jgi:branched-subunit amino acid transport protein AzlD